jgi:hypothetical protein
VEVTGIRWLGIGTEKGVASCSPSRPKYSACESLVRLIELAMGDGTKLELFGSAGLSFPGWLSCAQTAPAGSPRPVLPRGQARPGPSKTMAKEG